MTDPKIYEAERRFREILDSGVETIEIFGSTLTVPMERKFGSFAAVENYLAWLTTQPWFRAQYPGKAAPTVRGRQGQHKAHYQMGEIAIPQPEHGIPWAMREIVVLHEMAHHVSPVRGHGPEFAGAFQHLVREAMGPEAGLMLASAFEAGGVRWTYVMEKEGAA